MNQHATNRLLPHIVFFIWRKKRHHLCVFVFNSAPPLLLFLVNGYTNVVSTFSSEGCLLVYEQTSGTSYVHSPFRGHLRCYSSFSMVKPTCYQSSTTAWCLLLIQETNGTINVFRPYRGHLPCYSIRSLETPSCYQCSTTAWCRLPIQE